MARRTIVSIIGAVAIATALLFPASAGGPQPLPLSEAVPPAQRSQPVEPWGVINTTGCLWDFDDQDGGSLWGNLPAGQTTRFTGCVIADNLNGAALRPRLHFLVGAPKAIDVAVCYTAGPCIPIASQPDGNRIRYEACVDGPKYQSSYPMPPMPDGGFGIRHDYALVVTNATRNTVRDVVLTVSGGNDHDNCPLWDGVTVPSGDFAFGLEQP